MLASLLLANITACSNDNLPTLGNRQEQDSGSRTTELVTQTIELQSAGTLQARVEEAMGDFAVSTLQKLVLSGPFTSTDLTYLRDSLTGVSVLHMENVQIKASDEAYVYDGWAESYIQDNQICNHMFRNMDNLKELVLPATVTSLGESSFEDCDSLLTVILPEGLKTLGNSCFYSCESLMSITIPDKVEVIPVHAFDGCSSLATVLLPSSLKNIGSWSFANCRTLTELHLPESIMEIGNYAFYNCRTFTDLKLPESIKKIEFYAFFDCDGLQSLKIPADVVSVGYSFVASCDNLKTLVWNSVSLDVPDCWGVDNCYLFVNTDQIGVNNVNSWKAIVLNGVAETTIDINTGNWNSEFANLKEFTANKLVYTKNFSSWPETTPGGSSGWQTIVLPFSPDSIYHETKGQIAPFNSGIEGAKPFWLRELTSEGFVDVTKIEANKPYIIAMPNHETYLEEYRLYGNVTFVGKNQMLTITPAVLEPSVGPEFELHPTYKYIEPSDDVYTLGHHWNYYEEENMHYYKSFFRKNSSSVQKFNAYVTTLGGGRSSRTLFDLDTRSKETRAAWQPNTTGIPQIGDM